LRKSVLYDRLTKKIEEKTMTDTNEKLLNYLYSDFKKTIRDPLWIDIKLTNGFYELYLCPQVQQLNRIKQLGPTYLTYPGAVHTRLIHSLGVYHLSKMILISILKKDTKGLTFSGINSFLVAALLHDIGHFPYAHSLKEIISESHESLGARIIEKNTQIKSCIEEIGANVKNVCQIIDKSRITENKEIQLYRHLLSGAMDPDKLDYLSRDAFYCGVPYGIQDVSFIIDRLLIENNRPALKIENISSLEHLLFSKYLMYQNVYWNKNVRCATAMIKKAVTIALNLNIIKKEDLLDLDDQQFSNLGEFSSFKAFDLFKDVINNKLLHMVYEMPYDVNNTFCVFFQNSDYKLKTETLIWKSLKNVFPNLKPYEVIIDIPEPISFESNFQIIDEETIKSFNEIDPIFNVSSIENFTKALRKIRIFVPTYITPKENEIVKFIKKIGK